MIIEDGDVHTVIALDTTDLVLFTTDPAAKYSVAVCSVAICARTGKGIYKISQQLSHSFQLTSRIQHFEFFTHRR